MHSFLLSLMNQAVLQPHLYQRRVYLILPLARLCFSRSCMNDQQLNPATSGWYNWLKIKPFATFAAANLFGKIVHLPSGFRNDIDSDYKILWCTSPHTHQTREDIYYYHITTAVFNVLRSNLYLTYVDKSVLVYRQAESEQHDALTNQKERHRNGPIPPPHACTNIQL